MGLIALDIAVIAFLGLSALPGENSGHSRENFRRTQYSAFTRMSIGNAVSMGNAQLNKTKRLESWRLGLTGSVYLGLLTHRVD